MKTVRVTEPGNPSVAIVPFSDAIYETCADAPVTPQGCQMVGGVDRAYRIAQIEVTVGRRVTFLNIADPSGKDPNDLYSPTQNSALWPKYGQIDFDASTPGRPPLLGRVSGMDRQALRRSPTSFARLGSSTRLYNGVVLSKRAGTGAGFDTVTYRVRLSPRTGSGMYDLSHRRARAHRGIRLRDPESGRMDQGRLLRPDGRGDLLLLEVPDQ